MEIKYKYFWKSFSPFSNWYMSDFVLEGKTFKCMEQYMMWKKAMLFNDLNTAQLILNQYEPSKMKELGRMVKNFVAKVWDANKYEIVKTGIKAKFEQNQAIKETLLKYHGYTLVEASPYDRIWGIGFTEEVADEHYDEWGENLLGKILTEVCNELI